MMATRPPVPAPPRLALALGLAVLSLIAGAPAPAPDAPGTTRPGPSLAGEVHPTFLIRDARIVDGTGAPAFRGSVRIHGDRISSLGDLAPRAGERVIEAGGMLLVPGFIDAGETVGRLPESRDAAAAVSRGVTTIVVGTRGHHRHPLAAWFDSLRLAPYAVNVASFAGLRTLREAATSAVSPVRAGGGPGAPEPAAPDAEIEPLRELLRRELEAGALGLSVGAEPEPREGSATSILEALRPDVEAARGTVVSAGTAVAPGAVDWSVLPGSLARSMQEGDGPSLEAAVHRLTEAAALRVGIRGSSGGPRAGRGAIEPLAYADLVLLDPGRIADAASVPSDAESFPGIARVWVNGQEVYAHGGVTAARPGRVIRWPRM